MTPGLGGAAVSEPAKAPNGVSIEQIDGHWAVQIVEHGEVTQSLFVTEEFARNFAAGQRARLGLLKAGADAKQ